MQQTRPAHTEIIICTGLRMTGGIQYWGVSPRASSATASRSVERRSPGDGPPAPRRLGALRLDSEPRENVDALLMSQVPSAKSTDTNVDDQAPKTRRSS